MEYFVRTTPEAVGIETNGILAFLAGAMKAGLEMHRFMILRHGKCAAKISWEPYTQECMHPVYSFSKSLTATAIAFARQEGLLSLDDHIADIFSGELPEMVSENLKACTIHDLLCMGCGHDEEIIDESAGWKKAFLAHEFMHKPGTFFAYNTVGTNLLAAIVLRKTGQQVTDYLRSRLFDPLGMGEVFCFALPDEEHTQAGGGGMKLKLEDMAKFGQFMLQDGWWEGKCLLKDWYHKMAGVKQIETAGDKAGHIKDWAQGYGYQCWMNPYPGSFRADGAFGQFALVYPALDLCVIINAATEQTQTMMDILNTCLLPAVHADGICAQAGTGMETSDIGGQETGAVKSDIGMHSTFIPELFENRKLPALCGSRNPVFEQKLVHALYRKCDEQEPMEGIKRLVGGAGLYTIPDDGSITGIRFSFDENAVIMHMLENGEWKAIRAAFDGTFAMSEVDGLKFAACARWRGLRRLEMEIRRMDSMSGVRLIINFEGNTLFFEADETLMTDGGLGMTNRRLARFYESEDLAGIAVEKTGNNPSVF